MKRLVTQSEACKSVYIWKRINLPLKTLIEGSIVGRLMQIAWGKRREPSDQKYCNILTRDLRLSEVTKSLQNSREIELQILYRSEQYFASLQV